MSDERHHSAVDLASQHQFQHVPTSRALKRKRTPQPPSSKVIRQSYPSPPMSNHPSPSRPPIEPIPSTTTAPPPSITTGTQPARSQPPQPAALPLTQPLAYSSLPGHEPATLTSTTQLPDVAGIQAERFGTLPSGQNVFSVGQASTTLRNVEATPSGRPGRKAKAHVASACMNCKRAHLSCDIQRPCTRCVASGKQVIDRILR